MSAEGSWLGGGCKLTTPHKLSQSESERERESGASIGLRTAPNGEEGGAIGLCLGFFLFIGCGWLHSVFLFP